MFRFESLRSIALEMNQQVRLRTYYNLNAFLTALFAAIGVCFSLFEERKRADPNCRGDRFVEVSAIRYLYIGYSA